LRPRTKADEFLSHCEFASSQFSRDVSASSQISREVISTDLCDEQGSSGAVTVRRPVRIEGQNELGSKQPRDCAQPDACTTEQERAMNAMQSHGLASPQTRTAFLSNPSGHSAKMDMSEYRQEHGLQQQRASQLQEPSHRLSRVDGYCTGASGSNACQQGLLFSNACARPQPDSGRGLLESGVRALTPSESSHAPVPRPGVDADEAFESMQPGNSISELGREVESHADAASQMPPVRETANYSAASASGSPSAVHFFQSSNSRSCDLAEALLREMHARMLKASMPEYYED